MNVNNLVLKVCIQCLTVRTRVPVSSAWTTGSLVEDHVTLPRVDH